MAWGGGLGVGCSAHFGRGGNGAFVGIASGIGVGGDDRGSAFEIRPVFPCAARDRGSTLMARGAVWGWDEPEREAGRRRWVRPLQPNQGLTGRPRWRRSRTQAQRASSASSTSAMSSDSIFSLQQQ